ncbi:MAG: hypothetical protein UX61_C0023G0003 [Parcubacteria group bacterium GW2011_GWA2_46_7]|nr:MAG: hypothetical protein UX61_C0023G0003 [Parcubacteria group bacterium GW2011_GWA2_46_7]
MKDKIIGILLLITGFGGLAATLWYVNSVGLLIP